MNYHQVYYELVALNDSAVKLSESLDYYNDLEIPEVIMAIKSGFVKETALKSLNGLQKISFRVNEMLLDVIMNHFEGDISIAEKVVELQKTIKDSQELIVENFVRIISNLL